MRQQASNALTLKSLHPRFFSEKEGQIQVFAGVIRSHRDAFEEVTT